MAPRKRTLSERFQSLYLWHRYAGLVAALLAAWLSVTGLLLNHTGDLELATRYVEQEWLLERYGVTAPVALRGQRAGDHWLVNTGGRVYLDEKMIARDESVGIARLDEGFVVAFRDRLQLYTPDAVLVEELPFTASELPLQSVETHPKGVVVSTAMERFLVPHDLLTFERLASSSSVARQESEPLPEKLQAVIAHDVLVHTLSWERVLLDLHAGRLFGFGGRWLADLAGILLMLLAVTGVIIWAQRTTRRRRN